MLLLGYTTVPSPPIDLIACGISVKYPAAHAPNMAEPRSTDSGSFGHTTGRSTTSAWVWVKSRFLLSPPHIKTDCILL